MSMAMASGNGSDNTHLALTLAAEVPVMASSNESRNKPSDDQSQPWEYSLRKYLLLLATVVATVTYTAGFSPPGGVWEETDLAAGYHAGDPIIRHTSYHRYVVFFYLNAAAFASSLVVIVLILILSLLHEKKGKSLAPVLVLRGFMALDLLSIMGAYTAGIYRERDVPVYSMLLAALTIVYVVVFHMVLSCRPCHRRVELSDESESERQKCEKARKVLMLLATFAVSVTYVAGLSAPGGFHNNDEGGDRPGEPVLMGGPHQTRLKAFVHFNSTAFFFSLFIAVQLLDKKLVIKEGEVGDLLRSVLLYGSVVFALLGLVCAYATGSSRDTHTTIYVTLLGVAVPACIILLRVILHKKIKGQDDEEEEKKANGRLVIGGGQAVDKANGRWRSLFIALKFVNNDGGEAEDKARSLVLLLATLAATITYQAGLDPPGGLWENDGNGYMAGDPILRTTNPRRYDAFFYCNSGAFVASLVAIILVNKKNNFVPQSIETHAVQAAMILDLFGLIGAYAAGSCRDVSTSIYAMALAGAVLIYVVIHVVFFTLGHDTSGSDEVVEKRRKRLLLFAILAATITYQAGLTPPGGFWLRDDELGHHAGDPVLLSNSSSRYKGFFYCNSVSFMLSIALIILLVNPNLYRPAIQSHALSVCTAAGMFSLVGAYAAGSTQYMRTSMKIFGLVAAILIVAVLAVLHFVTRSKVSTTTDGKNKTTNRKKDEQHAWRKHLMLLGILAASVTYQVGLEPPGGVWQDDDNGLGHVAGNPIMRDNGRTRYLAFFYINSTSFVASAIVVIILLLEPFIMKMKKSEWMRAMNTTIELELLGLLVAYAVGSTRSWTATGYVFALVFSVLAYIAIHAMLLAWRISRNDPTKKGQVDPIHDSDPNKEERTEIVVDH